MTFSRFLTILGAVCLAAAMLRARPHLRANRGLRRGFGGLMFSALAGVALTFSTSPTGVWALALFMLGGVGFLVWALHVEQNH